MTTSLILPIEDLWADIGSPGCPALIDARTDEDFAADPRLIPGAVRRPGLDAAAWVPDFTDRAVAVYCERGLKISQGAAAWLCHAGANGRALAGGFQAWRTAGLPLVPEDTLPPRDAGGRTVWAAGADPDADVLACAWLIRRFVDLDAVFLWVEETEVAAVADRFGTASIGPEGATFAAAVSRFGLASACLAHFAAAVGGAVPEGAGLRAAVDGTRRLARDGGARLEAAMTVCDGFYGWCREKAQEEAEQ